MPVTHRLYTDLAPWWPLLSPPAEYAEEATFAASVLRTAAIPVRQVLELGSGGGHNAVHLKTYFAMTLVDLSAGMLAVSRRLNPECVHRHGDMRTVRLGQEFDAVFVHDAVDYMVTEDDLARVIATAFAHCRPGGVAVFVPDRTTESFAPETSCGGSDDGDGQGARFLAWLWDPDPADTWVQTDYALMLRGSDGVVDVVQESHRMGLFSRRVWLRLLAGAGFDAGAVTEVTEEDRPPREFFTGHRPR